MSEEVIQAIEGDYENSALLSLKEKCIIRWAEMVTKNEAKYDQDCWTELSTYLLPKELIELTMVVCLFNAVNRLNDSLLLDPDFPPDRMRSLKVTPSKLQKYVHEILLKTN